VDFEFSASEQAFRETVRNRLGGRADCKAAHAVLNGDALFDEDLWKYAVVEGWVGLAIPEDLSGSGRGYPELCILAEEFGRVIAPIPFGPSVFVFTEAIRQAGSRPQQERWLPALADATAIGTFALTEGSSDVHNGGCRTVMRNGKVTGHKIPVVDGMIATAALVLVSDQDAGDKPSLVLVDLSSAGVRRDPVKTIDLTRPAAELTLDGVVADRLGRPGHGRALLERVESRAAVLFAFEQLGGAQASLENARDEALARTTFGRSVASYQAVKHKLADVYAAVEIARAHAYFAAWALNADAPELMAAAAAARVAASEAFALAAKETVHLHGAKGYRWDGNCHLYYRRSRHLALSIGSPRMWKERLISYFEKTVN